MHTTTEQNKAHRNDIAWMKTKGKSFHVNGELYISEYLNPWNGMAIRKSWRMTGHDWFIFDAAGKSLLPQQARLVKDLSADLRLKLRAAKFKTRIDKGGFFLYR